MGRNDGKYYYAEEVQNYCDYMKQSATNYRGYADVVHTSHDDFYNNELFNGETADKMKLFLKGGTGQMLVDLTDIHQQMVDDQTYMINQFETMVDPAKYARIEYTTLELINSDFRGYYSIYARDARDVRQIVTDLNNDFGHYKYFPQPDSNTGKTRFEFICGGEAIDAGYFKSCQQKFVAFDNDVYLYLKGRDTVDRKINLDNRINNTTATLLSYKPGEFGESKGFMDIIGEAYGRLNFLKDGTLDRLLREYMEANAASLAFFAALAKALVERNGDDAYEAFKQYIGWITEDTWNDLLSFIPEYISNEAFLEFYESLRHGRIPEGFTLDPLMMALILAFNDMSLDEINAHYNDNVANLQSSGVYTPGSFIENQWEWGSIEYGRYWSNMQFSGCEIIAVANALHNMGVDLSYEEMAELIRNFEKDGMCLDGNIGTSPMALYEYLVNHGYTAEYTTSNVPKDIQEISEKYDTFVVTAYNEKDDITGQVHTVCITKGDDGKYYIHNGGTRSGDGRSESIPYDSLEEAINDIGGNDNSQSIIITGVKDDRLIGDFEKRDESEGVPC